MFRSMLYSLVLLGVSVGLTAADPVKAEVKAPADKNAKEGKITKVDAKKHTVTLKTETEGKPLEKTFKLAEDIEYMDSTGKVGTLEIFTSGDEVLYVEVDGTISKLKKHDKPESTPKPVGK